MKEQNLYRPLVELQTEHGVERTMASYVPHTLGTSIRMLSREEIRNKDVDPG